MNHLLKIAVLLTGFVLVTFQNKNYEEIKKGIENKRQIIQKIYSASDSSMKDSLIKVVRTFVFSSILKDIFPKWYNTPWDFNGTTTVPGQGTIACGYFVTTVLQHAGFKIPRVKWAQCASETMIKKMTKDIKRFHDAPIEDVISLLKKREDGLYIAGLDSHTGFLYKKGNEIKFVHSNYYQADIGVMSQEPYGDNPLNDSRYRVVGRILSDEMMKKWIMGEEFE